MIRYPALIDGKNGAYGVVFPDWPGIAAMGATIDEAMVNAEDALQDAAAEARADGTAPPEPSIPEAVEVPPGNILTSVPLIEVRGKSVRANMTLDSEVLAFIDAEAARRDMTRTAYVTWMARRMAQMGG